MDGLLYNVQMLEVGRDATNVTGYFTTHTPPSHIGNGADVWFKLDEENHWPFFCDFASLGEDSCPAPWTIAGSFTWEIPAKWKVVIGPTSSGEHTISGWNQIFSIQAGGTVSIQKFGRTVTRTTSNVTTHN